jgi:SAM-dependent methyltransferase
MASVDRRRAAELDPAGRTPARLAAHYEIERELADRLRNSTPEKRAELYSAVYDELFARVPDHPQLTLGESPELRQQRLSSQVRLVNDFLDRDATFLEIGAGDCALSLAVAPTVAKVYAIEVSETIAATAETPPNFTLLISDGRSIPVPAGSVTLAYSNQLMEHLHPDDASEQVRAIGAAIKPGGAYICLTPHRAFGPSDISAFVDEEATGFHLKEYTTSELSQLFRHAGFRTVRVVARVAGRRFYLPAPPFIVIERLVMRLPKRVRRNRYVRKLVSPGGGVVGLK